MKPTNGRPRVAAVSGLAGAVLVTAGWIVGGLSQPAAYRWTAQEVSDLGALTARHAWVWNASDSLSGVLLAIFALGLYGLVRFSRAGRTGAGLVGVVGVGSVLDGLLREDCPLSTSAACQRRAEAFGLSWHHQAHDIESIVVFAAMLTAPFMLAKAFRRVDGLRGLSRLSRATGFTLIAATVAYIALYGDTGGGLAERAMALVYMAWIAVIGITMLRGASAWSRTARSVGRAPRKSS